MHNRLRALVRTITIAGWAGVVSDKGEKRGKLLNGRFRIWSRTVSGLGFTRRTRRRHEGVGTGAIPP